MLLVKTIDELKDVLFRIKSNGKSVGFVPTMGALHEGHLALIKKARKENEVVVCSIFVNPIQFNNVSDLQKYPRDLERDSDLLNSYTDIIFAPSVEEVFPDVPEEHYNFGELDTTMEGASRAGHFNGVAIIVRRLLEWIKPDKVYFGEKDFQQLVIVKRMVQDLQIPVQVISCPIVRENNGLAMSSRNERLSPEERNMAGNMHHILDKSTKLGPVPVKQIKEFVVSEIARYPLFRLDYFEIVDDRDLRPVDDMDRHEGVIGCVAWYIGDVRLIDNIRYK